MKYVMYQQDARDENAWLFWVSSNVKGDIWAENNETVVLVLNCYSHMKISW